MYSAIFVREAMLSSARRMIAGISEGILGMESLGIWVKVPSFRLPGLVRNKIALRVL